MQCVAFNLSVIEGRQQGTGCVSSVKGSHIAISGSNVSTHKPFEFRAYLDEWQSGSGYAGWQEIGYRTGMTTPNGTHLSMSPNTYGATKTYRVRFHLIPFSSNIYATTGSFSHNSSK